MLLKEFKRAKAEPAVEYLIHLLQRLRARTYTLLLSPSFFSIGDGTIIEPPLRFANLNGVVLGRCVHINKYGWIVTDKKVQGENEPKIIIKDYSAIGMNVTISAAKKIVIEEHVLLARNVYISDHGHEFSNIETPIMYQGIRKIAEVRIGAGTWLGQNSVILPGANIGRNCVIGANSVVNTEIPDFSIAVGAPAKIVSQYSKSKKDWLPIFQNE